MSRRRSSLPLRCWQLAGTAGLFVGTALLLHAVGAWIYGGLR